MVNLENIANKGSEMIPRGSFHSDDIVIPAEIEAIKNANKKYDDDFLISNNITKFINNVNNYLTKTHNKNNKLDSNHLVCENISKDNYIIFESPFKNITKKYIIDLSASKFLLGAGGYDLTFDAKCYKDNKFVKDVALKVAIESERSKSLYEQRGTNSSKDKDKAQDKSSSPNLKNVVRSEYMESDKGLSFLVEEKYDEFLHTYIAKKGGKLTLEDTLDKLETLSEALVSLHENGIMYLDLKADNVALHNLTKKGWLTDFNMASIDYASDNNKLGGRYIRSPKLFNKNSKADFKNDQFGFVNLFYKSITGKNLLEDEIDTILNDAKKNHPEIVCERELMSKYLYPEIASRYTNEDGSFNKKYEKLLDYKLCDVPKKWKDFLRKGFMEKYDNMGSLNSKFQEIKSGKNFFQKHLDKLVIGGVISYVGLIGLLGYNSYRNQEIENINMQNKFNETYSKIENIRTRNRDENELEKEITEYIDKGNSFGNFQSGKKYRCFESARDLIILNSLDINAKQFNPNDETSYVVRFKLNDSNLNSYKNKFPELFECEFFNNATLPYYEERPEDAFGKLYLSLKEGEENKYFQMNRATELMEDFSPKIRYSIQKRAEEGFYDTLLTKESVDVLKNYFDLSK